MAGDQDKQDGGIVGFTKPRRFLGIKLRSKPIYGSAKQQVPQPAYPGSAAASASKPAPQFRQADDLTAAATQPVQRQYQPAQAAQQQAPPAQVPQQPAAPASQPAPQGQHAPKARPPGKVSRFQIYLDKTVAKHKELEVLLRNQFIAGGPQRFVKRMMVYAVILAVIVGAVAAFLLDSLLVQRGVVSPIMPSLLIGAVVAFGCYQFAFRQFLLFPYAKARAEGRQVEAGILFAARDMIISLRSGIPLFNAMMSVSSGYGAASREFEKIISLIQLGTPMDQAIDEVSRQSSSMAFKRIMLQASVSIKEGADVVSALEEVVEQVMQERVIELRRYGQRLNAISMFYMLFGIIFPSMGIAVLTILTTFISIFTVNTDFLVLILAFIGIMQLIFLNIMRKSRPIFAM